MIDVKIDQRQLQSIIKKCDPALVKKPLAGLMKEAGAKGNEVAKTKIKGGTKQAQFSMRYDTKPMEAKVYSLMPQARATSIEEGRKSGEEVPYMQAARYVLNRRYLTQRRLSGLTEDERGRIDAFINKVKAGGAKGKAFIEGAAEAVQKDLPKMLDKIAKEIESRFRL